MLRTENWSNPTFSSTVLDVVYELGWALICHSPLQNVACKYKIEDMHARAWNCSLSFMSSSCIKIFSISTFRYEMTWPKIHLLLSRSFQLWIRTERVVLWAQHLQQIFSFHAYRFPLLLRILRLICARRYCNFPRLYFPRSSEDIYHSIHVHWRIIM